MPDDFYDALNKQSNLAIPFIQKLKTELPKNLSTALHYGATSEDLIDTAQILLIKETFEILEMQLLKITKILYSLTLSHKDSLMLGRTLNQNAIPTTFGFKLAQYLQSFLEVLEQVQELKTQLPLSFGGAVGTQAASQSKGVEVMDFLAQKLKLKSPNICWHTNRNIILKIVAVYQQLLIAADKIVSDFLFLSQTAIGEVCEKSAGGSSAMPQKRNPVKMNSLKAYCHLGISDANSLVNLKGFLNERDPRMWHAQWSSLASLNTHCLGVNHLLELLLAGLGINAEKMQENLAANGGFEMAENLIVFLKNNSDPSVDATTLIEKACKEAMAKGVTLKKIVQVIPEFKATNLEKIFDAKQYLGSSEQQIKRVLTSYKKIICQF